MILVPDSSALITLARIGQLGLLRELAETVHIPEGVYEEVVRHGQTKLGSSEVSEAQWILQERVKDWAGVNRLMGRVGRGEAEAIMLAQELQADFVILDDATARAVAEGEGRTVLGLLGLLIYAKERGLVSAIKPIVDAMLSAGFYIDRELYHTVLQRAGEKSTV